MELLMLVGMPGSGKSSLSEVYREKGWRIHSSDRLRLELYGSEDIQGNSSEIFQKLENRAVKDLQAGFNCVLDATNLGRKRRMNMLRRFSAIGCRKQCMVVLAEPEVCRQRNQSRDRKVPEEAMDKMLRAFETPYFYEGWDAIDVTYTGNGWRFPFDEAMELSQDNPYHSLTLGEHLQAAESYARDHGFSATVQEAAAYHDIGKFYTKTFTNARGEPSETAHFYGHENAGAYLYLCEKAANAKTREELNRVLYIASLINWHMRVMQVWKDNEKVRDRDRELIGPEMVGELWQLYEADREAHKV